MCVIENFGTNLKGESYDSLELYTTKVLMIVIKRSKTCILVTTENNGKPILLHYMSKNNNFSVILKFRKNEVSQNGIIFLKL